MWCAWRVFEYLVRESATWRLGQSARSDIACGQRSGMMLASEAASDSSWFRIIPGAKYHPHLIFSAAAVLMVGLVQWLAVKSANHSDLETEGRNTESELLRLRQAVDASGEAIFLTDRNGIISYVNPEFTRIYGYSFQELVGIASPRVLKSGLMLDQDYVEFWKTLLNRQICKGEIINRCKDGRLITVDSSANAIVDQDGKIIGFLAIQRDITERKRAEKELRHRNRELAILNSVSSAVSQSLNLEQVLEDALAEVLQLDIFEANAKGMVFLLDKQRAQLSLVTYRGAPEDHPCIRTPVALGECLCGLAAAQGRMIVSDVSLVDERHTRCPDIASHKDICLPLKAHGEVLGVMSVRLTENFTITDSDQELLTSVADQIALAIENAGLFEEISRQRHHLRALSTRSAEMEEAERRRLSRELHDQVGQNLSAVGLNLTITRTLIAEDDLAAALTCLVDSQALIEHITERIRGLMVELRPPILDD